MRYKCHRERDGMVFNVCNEGEAIKMLKVSEDEFNWAINCHGECSNDEYQIWPWGLIWEGEEIAPRSGTAEFGWWAAQTEDHEPSGPFDTELEAMEFLDEACCD